MPAIEAFEFNIIKKNGNDLYRLEISYVCKYFSK